MRTAPLFAAALLAFAPATVHAQDSSEATQAVETVEAFMKAFSAQDADAMSAYIASQGSVAMVQEREGEDRTGFVSLDQIIASISQNASDLEEPMWNFTARAEGPIAVVFGEYEFLVDGERSHCGWNMFSLMRVDSEWKIANITYSHIAEGCEGQPAE